MFKLIMINMLIAVSGNEIIMNGDGLHVKDVSRNEDSTSLLEPMVELSSTSDYDGLCGLISPDNSCVHRDIGWSCSDPTENVCTWKGVSCTNGVVTQLIFDAGVNIPGGGYGVTYGIPWNICGPGNIVLGTISTTIGKLTGLTSFHWNTGYTYSEIPTEIGYLTNLVSLKLQPGGQFHGKIPTSLGLLTKLETLDLDNNAL